MVEHLHLSNNIAVGIFVEVFLRFSLTKMLLTDVVCLGLSNVHLFDRVEFTQLNLVLLSWCSSAAMLRESTSEFLEGKEFFFLSSVIIVLLDIISIGLLKGFFVNL